MATRRRNPPKRERHRERQQTRQTSPVPADKLPRRSRSPSIRRRTTLQYACVD